jgi:hypothetical protein
MSNCYARSTLTQISSVFVSGEITVTGKNGAQVSQSQWQNATWWRNTAGFTTTGWPTNAYLPLNVN